MYAVGEEVPHVCEQIGCPLCSVIACIYTEYADTASVLEENKQRRVPLAAETLTQLQSYITDNSIPAEAPLFSITQQWIRMLINKYARLIGKNIHPPHLPA